MMRIYNLMIFILFLFCAINMHGQIPLLIENKPNKNIQAYFKSKSLNFIQINYDSFINPLLNDSFYRKEFNLNPKNTNIDEFKLYIIPQAYYKENIDEWRESNYDLINYIEIDTSVYFGAVYFQKGKLTYILVRMLEPNNPHFDFVSNIYNPNGEIISKNKSFYFESRFYKYILKSKPDNIFIIRGYYDYICFQKGTKIYFYNPYSNQVESLNYFKNNSF